MRKSDEHLLRMIMPLTVHVFEKVVNLMMVPNRGRDSGGMLLDKGRMKVIFLHFRWLSRCGLGRDDNDQGEGRE